MQSILFLRSTTRKKDGKEHRYYSVVESVPLFSHIAPSSRDCPLPRRDQQEDRGDSPANIPILINTSRMHPALSASHRAHNEEGLRSF